MNQLLAIHASGNLSRTYVTIQHQLLPSWSQLNRGIESGTGKGGYSQYI